jgi:hypothetical protein
MQAQNASTVGIRYWGKQCQEPFFSPISGSRFSKSGPLDTCDHSFRSARSRVLFHRRGAAWGSRVVQRCAYSVLLCGHSPIPCEFVRACPGDDRHFRLKSRGGALKSAHLLATCSALPPSPGYPLREEGCQVPFPGRHGFLTVFSNPNCATALLTHPSDPYGLLLFMACRISLPSLTPFPSRNEMQPRAAPDEKPKTHFLPRPKGKSLLPTRIAVQGRNYCLLVMGGV